VQVLREKEFVSHLVEKLSSHNQTNNYLLSIKLVIDSQEKLMKTCFYRRSLINNRLKKLNTATLNNIEN
jgi:hypothetical protein